MAVSSSSGRKPGVAGTNRNAPIIPVNGCWVSNGRELGMVQDHRLEGRNIRLLVTWPTSGVTKWHGIAELRSGFRPNHVVRDIPKSNTRVSLGVGTVRAERRIADRYQILVQLHETGETRWLPYERLIRIADARHKFERLQLAQDNPAERFRLKALAYALDSWNQVTGALDRFDVDPLPHQIDIVHRIMTSDQSNWLIGDDVGLGKTIEVGLLLAALKRRRQARRVLVVCPAGLVRQWQDEMADKFNEDFKIYGYDFNINQPSHWHGNDKVIVSIDRAKSNSHKASFRESGDWDVVIFDEAHHLSRIENQAITQRYQLAQQLRDQTDAFVFLSGTPHSGKREHFANILRLLRPDLTPRLEKMFTDPSVVAEVILRNQKSKVTDANGRFIFRGQDTRMIEVHLSNPAHVFSAKLQDYLRNGYAVADTRGAKGRAIGFVMTTYRKLASSSIAAIERALKRRKGRLQGDLVNAVSGNSDLREVMDAAEDGTDGQDDLDNVADSAVDSAAPFFESELEDIEALLEAAQTVKSDDRKIRTFLDEVVNPIVAQGEKLLIFTEYRATQDYIVQALEKRYPDLGVAQINGSMDLNEKLVNIQQFNERRQFMVTTEAGGEGINLHQNCHILVNYDLPWNPGRLVQRAGRLYRYGQSKRVVVFNLLLDDGFDNRALGMMLDRVTNIARDLADVSEEFNEGLETEILGELLERVDIASLLAQNSQMVLEYSQQEINEAIYRAQNAQKQQETLFSSIEGYDPASTAISQSFGPQHVMVFLEGILPYKGIQIRNRRYRGQVLELELPSNLRGFYSEFGMRSVVRVTAYRDRARSLIDVVPMDFKSPFFKSLIDCARSPEFQGEYASIVGPKRGALALYKLRWQTDQGMPTEERLQSVFLPAGSQQPQIDPDFFGELLSNQATAGTIPEQVDHKKRQTALKLLDDRADAQLAERCTALRHPNDVILLAAADLV